MSPLLYTQNTFWLLVRYGTAQWMDSLLGAERGQVLGQLCSCCFRIGHNYRNSHSRRRRTKENQGLPDSFTQAPSLSIGIAPATSECHQYTT